MEIIAGGSWCSVRKNTAAGGSSGVKKGTKVKMISAPPKNMRVGFRSGLGIDVGLRVVRRGVFFHILLNGRFFILCEKMNCGRWQKWNNQRKNDELEGREDHIHDEFEIQWGNGLRSVFLKRRGLSRLVLPF